MRLFHSRISCFVILSSQVSAIPVLGLCVLPSSPSFLVVAMRGMWDVGCGLPGWLCRQRSDFLRPAKANTASRQCVPRIPGVQLLLWNQFGMLDGVNLASPSSPLPFCPPPSASSQSSSPALEPRRGGVEEKMLLSFLKIRLQISLERPGVFELAWRLADDRGRWSWWRVINKHFSRTGKKCRQAPVHQPAMSSLAPPQDAKYKSCASLQAITDWFHINEVVFVGEQCCVGFLSKLHYDTFKFVDIFFSFCSLTRLLGKQCINNVGVVAVVVGLNYSSNIVLTF